MTAKSWSQARFWTRVEALGARWEWLSVTKLFDGGGADFGHVI